MFLSSILSMGQLQTITYKEVTTNGEKEATLQFDQNRSVYFSHSIKNTHIARKADGSTVFPANSVDSIANKPRFVYFDRNSKLFYNNIINRNIESLIVDSAKIKWQILNEYKVILGKTCRKASAEWFGSKYIAWFNIDNKLPYGPLKFNGLPGLILDLQDTSGKLKVVATNITNGSSEHSFFRTITKYDLSKAVTRKRYDEIIEGYLQDAERELQISLPKNKDGKINLNCNTCN